MQLVYHFMNFVLLFLNVPLIMFKSLQWNELIALLLQNIDCRSNPIKKSSDHPIINVLNAVR